MLESLFKGSFDHGNGSNPFKIPKLDILVNVRPKTKFTKAITQLRGPALGVTGTSSGINRPELMLRNQNLSPKTADSYFLFLSSVLGLDLEQSSLDPHRNNLREWK